MGRMGTEMSCREALQESKFCVSFGNNGFSAAAQVIHGGKFLPNDQSNSFMFILLFNCETPIKVV